jgi:hypothetical protein
MLVPEARRQQRFNGLPQQFFSAVSKQLLHLRIDQDDFPVSIHHHHRIRRCFQKLSELPFRHQPLSSCTQVLLGLPAFGYVPRDPGEPVRLSGRPVIDLSSGSHRPDRAAGPYDAKFRVIFRAAFDRLPDFLLNTPAVVRVNHGRKPLHRFRELADRKTEQD